MAIKSLETRLVALEKKLLNASDPKNEIKKLKQKIAELKKLNDLLDHQYLSLVVAVTGKCYRFSHLETMRMAEHYRERCRKMDVHGKDIGPIELVVSNGE